MTKICICGDGLLAHVYAGVLSFKKEDEVNIFSRKQDLWQHRLDVSNLGFFGVHRVLGKGARLIGFQRVPLKTYDGGWVPDFESRYFTEDFPYGLTFIWRLAHENRSKCPNIDKVYEWVGYVKDKTLS